ncbi:hypothetical protein FOPE_12693 [Fonsecaea pedrosoi]|nr:hypothetical protein FOPE_12693 [Fonsecaea pedrosoi]
MPDSGTFFFISDHCHVIENVSVHPPIDLLSTELSLQWRDGIPQGWLARDHPSWFQSTQRLKQLERTTKGKVIPGHDKGTFEELVANGNTYT